MATFAFTWFARCVLPGQLHDAPEALAGKNFKLANAREPLFPALGAPVVRDDTLALLGLSSGPEVDANLHPTGLDIALFLGAWWNGTLDPGKPIRSGKSSALCVDVAGGGPAIAKHRIPVIDRMMDVLFQLEKRAGGATIRDLVEALRLPRTTVYRILNTLQFHDVVRRTAEGSYRLGPRLIALAARTFADAQDYDLATLSMPHLERLSEVTGEGSKVSVLDGDAILVVAAVQGTRQYALSVVPGQRLPLHAGAAFFISVHPSSASEVSCQ